MDKLETEYWDQEEIASATGLPDDIVDIITSLQSRCTDYYACKGHLSEMDIDASRAYCLACVKVCIMPDCCLEFTPDFAGSRFTLGMCGKCSTCMRCKGIQWDRICPCDGSYESGLREEPPERPDYSSETD
jgi:hypothetical protein